MNYKNNLIEYINDIKKDINKLTIKNRKLKIEYNDFKNNFDLKIKENKKLLFLMEYEIKLLENEINYIEKLD